MDNVPRLAQDLLAATPPEERPAAVHAMQAGAAVHTALRVLGGANLSPKWGTDLDDIERVWSARLSSFSPEAILKAADAWISDAHEFPDLAEFVTLVTGQERRQAALERGRANPRPDDVCTECGDSSETPTEGWVTMEDDGRCQRVLRPCSLCNPERYAAWKRGWRREKHPTR